MQAKKDFLNFTLAQNLLSILKLILGFIFVYIGGETFGALFGLALASLFSLLYARKHASELTIRLTSFKLAYGIIKKYREYAALIFFTFFFVTALYSTDVLIVKRLFSPEEAGLYSGIATIGRIIYTLQLPKGNVI